MWLESCRWGRSERVSYSAMCASCGDTVRGGTVEKSEWIVVLQLLGSVGPAGEVSFASG